MRNFTVMNRIGSSMVMSLLAVAVVGIIGLAGMSLSDFVLKSSSGAAALQNVDNFAQSATLLLNNPTICMSGPTGSGTGFQFDSHGGTFDSANATVAAGQDVKFVSNIRTSNTILTPLTLQTGAVVPSYSLTIKRLYIANMTLLPAPPNPVNTYSGEVYATILLANGRLLAPRLLATVTLQLNMPAGTIAACSALQTAQMMCQNVLNCTWQPTMPDKKCVCAYPDMTCPAGQQMTGINPDNTPVCQPYTASCSGGAYMVGFDTAHNPVCVLVATIPTTTTPPTTTTLPSSLGTCRVVQCNDCGGGPCVFTDTNCWFHTENMRMDDCFNKYINNDDPNAHSTFASTYDGSHMFNQPNNYGGRGVEWYPPTAVTCTISGNQVDTAGFSASDPHDYYMHNTYTCTDGDNGFWDIAGWCANHATMPVGYPGGVTAWCATPAPVTDPCPAGTSRMGLGAAANATCNCANVGETWTGATCTGGNPCPIGTSLTGAGGLVTGSPGCKCAAAGQNWSYFTCM